MTSRVLIVDDNPDIRLLVATVLDRAGLEVMVASGGTAAVALLARDPLPDVILLDVQMPDVDGWATLETIRADPRTCELPTILCTVKASLEDAERGWRLGCDGYVTKPFDTSRLLDEIRAVASRSSSERERVRLAGLDSMRRARIALAH